MHSTRLIEELTDRNRFSAESVTLLRRFAHEFGWRPSDELLDYPGTTDYCNGHIIVEHGLSNAAVISFLDRGTPYLALDSSHRRTLLGISYNHLVDWHLFPDVNGTRVVFNRTEPATEVYFQASSSDDVWSSSAFRRLTSDRPRPGIQNIEGTFLETVRLWRRAIGAEFKGPPDLEAISSLLNLIILVRAVEDYRRLNNGRESTVLLDELDKSNEVLSPHSLMKTALQKLNGRGVPSWLNQHLNAVNRIPTLDATTLDELFKAFYYSRFHPYRFDFSLISKHALSRLYESYIAELKNDPDADPRFWSDLSDEVVSRDLGAVYTPAYLARFFGRYLREHLPPRIFRKVRVLDPACGSGIFLRTINELRTDPFFAQSNPKQAAEDALANTVGVDIDINACRATELSLALLNLVTAGEFPSHIDVRHQEALAELPSMGSEFDVVVANPPFIKWDDLPLEWRDAVRIILDSNQVGKNDAYLAFLKGSVDCLRDGGTLMFVLPHAFLLSKAAAGLREYLSQRMTIRVVADLSEIDVFPGVGSYVVLLIAEKSEDRSAPATIVRCRAFPGHALSDAIRGRHTETEAYQIYELPQMVFKRDEWVLRSAAAEDFHAFLQQHTPLEHLLDIRQGVNTGNDDVFVVAKKLVPREERAIWKDVLSDREMRIFGVPRSIKSMVFYPVSSTGERLDVKEIRDQFPWTWKYLKSRKAELSERSSVVNEVLEWWMPERPRSPAKLLRPKLVTPHLILLPRFGVDSTGRFAVLRAPILLPKVGENADLLYYLAGCLNSRYGHWQLQHESHKYSRGYLMMEIKTLKRIMVPRPSGLDAGLLASIVNLAKRLARDWSDDSAEEMERLVAQAYGRELPE